MTQGLLVVLAAAVALIILIEAFVYEPLYAAILAAVMIAGLDYWRRRRKRGF